MKEKICVIRKKIKSDDVGRDALIPVHRSDLDTIAKILKIDEHEFRKNYMEYL